MKESVSRIQCFIENHVCGIIFLVLTTFLIQSPIGSFCFQERWHTRSPGMTRLRRMGVAIRKNWLHPQDRKRKDTGNSTRAEHWRQRQEAPWRSWAEHSSMWELPGQWEGWLRQLPGSFAQLSRWGSEEICVVLSWTMDWATHKHSSVSCFKSPKILT